MQSTLLLPDVHPSSPARRRLLAGGAASATLVLFGCGGGGGGGGDVSGVGSTADASFSSGPISGFGSIIVNNLRYDDTAARILDDAGQAVTTAALRLGMVVEVNGSGIAVDASGLRRSVASTISLRSEIEGPITAIDTAARTFAVLGQTVQWADATLYSDNLPNGAASLAVGQVVQVFGLRNPDGLYSATLVVRDEPVPTRYKLRGVVSALDGTAQTFRIGGAVIAYGAVASQAPGIANGQYARVELQTAPDASGRWVASALRTTASSVTLPSGSNVAVELKGYVTAFTSNTAFSVNGVPVSASGVANPPAGLALGRRVDVKGVFVSGQFNASEIALEEAGSLASRSFDVKGSIQRVIPAASVIVVRGLPVHYASARFEGGTASDLAENRSVEIQAQVAAGTFGLVAQTIRFVA